MLFVKNLVFLDGAIATLAPELDLFAEIAHLSMVFAEKHGQRIMDDLGLRFQEGWEPDLTGFKASFGLDESVESLTYKEVQDRRAKIRESLQSTSGPGRRRRKPNVR
jgi:ubiquinone biosynthesis protein